MGVLSNNNAQIVPGALISASYVSDIYSVLMGEEREDIMISGSLNITGSIYGNLIGTASYFSGSVSNAENAESSSYALTASYALNAGGIDTGSLITTSSFESFTSSYYTDSASFDNRIIIDSLNLALSNDRITELENFSSSINTVFTSITDFTTFTSSYLAESTSIDIRILDNSSSIDLSNVRITNLENFSSSIDDVFVNETQYGTFTASYYLDSASYDTRITNLENFSSSLDNVFVSEIEFGVFTSSYQNDSSSFDTRTLNLENFSSSLNDTYTTDVELNAATASLSESISFLSSSYLSDSSSFDSRIIDNSSSIDSLNSNFIALSGSYNTGSFTGSFIGTLTGTADVALNANNADLLDNRDSSTFANTGSNIFVGNQEISGSIQLNPTQDPGNGNVDSSFLFVSTSADNTEFNLHYRNNGALWETHWLEERTDTGLVWGGVVTFSGTDIFITPGAGLIVNHNANTGSHGDTQATYVTFGPITASATFISSSQVTYLLIDTDGSLIQQTSIFTPQQYNEKLPLGYIFSLTTSSISSYADARVTTYGQDEQQSQFIRAFGPLKINGYDLTPQSGSLRLSIGSGRSYRAGGFYSQNPQNPSVYDSDSVATGSFVRIYRDPSVIGGFRATLNGFFPFQTVDPTKWDDGSGTLATVASNEWTIQRLFQGVVNGITYVYYGQNTYDSLASAIQSISTEPFEESPTSILALPFIGYVITKGDTTNLSDFTNNKIINSGLFRNTAGSSGGGGVATTNINDLADVDITTPSTGQALIYNSGVWQNGTPLNSTSASFSSTASYINGGNVDGNITGNSTNITAYSINQNLSNTSQVTFSGVTSSFTGSFNGDGGGLYNIPANSIVGLNLSQISSGSVSASISPISGLQVNTFVTATSFTGSLLGTASIASTASYVLNAVSSSFSSIAALAQTASFVETAQTASYVLNAISASYSISSSQAISSSFSISASNALSSSFATTASFINTAQTASYVLNAVSSSFATTASFATSASRAVSSSFATTSSFAQTASFITTAQTASYVLNAVSSSFAQTASFTPNAIVTASVAGDTITFTKGNGTTFPLTVLSTISGSGSVEIRDEGATLTTGVTSINFSGSLISATNAGSAVTVQVPGLTYTAISSSTPQTINSATFTLLTGTNIIPAAGTYLVHSVVYGTVGTNNSATLETALYYNAVQQPATIGIIGGDGSLQAPISTQMILISNGVSTFEVRGRVTTSVGTAEGYYITLVKIA